MSLEPFRGVHSWEIFDLLTPEQLGDRPAWTPQGTPDPHPPRDAATVVPIRERGDGLCVWMMQRRPELVFGGMWVFPGGKVDPVDEGSRTPLLACAAREYREETGLGVRPSELVRWSRWITPVESPVRFDTHFYLTLVPPEAEPVADAGEAAACGWFDPRELVDPGTAAANQPRLMTPTRTVLWELALLGSWPAIREAAERREIRPVLARVARTGATAYLSHPRRDGTWT